MAESFTVIDSDILDRDLFNGVGVAIGNLTAATNELTRIFVKQELGPEDFRAATGIACKALNALYYDQELDEAFVSLSELSERESKLVNSIIDEVDHFTIYFLRRELDMLEEQFHVDPLLLAAVRRAAQELQAAVRAEHPNLVQVKQRIASLRDDACAISSGVKTSLGQSDRRKRLLQYALTGLGGIVIIADHTPVATSYFSPAGTASSWKLGIGLIAVASNGLYGKILEKIGAALG